ncbi:MAG: aspartate/glutamate racemase family protein [Pseudomonadales bacterium]|nr:aspartate/glutamate racemase family protein [Pseudomonadales bacterium]
MHIGMIGGIGPAATVFYYQQLVDGFARRSQALHLTIVNSSAKTLTENLAAGCSQEQAAEFLRVSQQLVGAGADCVVITSMGGHFCLPDFSPLSPLPIIEGPRSVRDHLLQAGISKPGILGTRKVMESALYGQLDELEPVIPLGEELEQANRDYVDMAIAGVATADQRSRLLAAGEKLIREQGAEVVLLGGTDLSIVYDETTNIPFIDTAQVHVDAIIKEALEG